MSSTLRKLIEKHEGYSLTPYFCSKGKETIGIGWNITDNSLPFHILQYLKKYKCITDQMVVELYEDAVINAIRDCNRLYQDFATFTVTRQDALIDFLFIGYPRAKGFVEMNKAINTGDWATAAKEMLDSLYAKQAPTRAKELAEMLRNG